MNEEFRKQRARTVRALAEKAGPFTKKRLLDLAARYEQAPRPLTPLPTIAVGAVDNDAGPQANSSMLPSLAGLLAAESRNKARALPDFERRMESLKGDRASETATES